MKRNFVYSVRLAPAEVAVITQLANAFTKGDRSELVRGILHQVGQSYNVLSPGDLEELEHVDNQREGDYLPAN